MDATQRNLAETLAEVLPRATIVHEPDTQVPGLRIAHVALPRNTNTAELKTDLEAYLPNPRATKATATFSDTDSFLAYMHRHATEGSIVWCSFDPQTFALSFTGVIDEHVKGTAGWRRHKAKFDPDMSAEWKAWKGQDRKGFEQTAFAEWIQDHQEDISASNSLPTSIQMLEMATNFVMNENRSLKSAVRLQSGGVNFTYVADPDSNTVEHMKVFEFFGLAVPVFHGDKMASSITARLKYRNNSGKLTFSYELQRADKAHKAAAEDLIGAVRTGLGSVPLLMGSCS